MASVRLVVLAVGAVAASAWAVSRLPAPAPDRAPPAPLLQPVKDPLLGVGHEAVDCYVDVLDHPELTTAGVLGSWLRHRVVADGQQRVRLVHPIRATLRVSHTQGSFLLTFEYDGTDQTDAGAPPRTAWLPFLGVTKALCADAKPHLVFQIGLLLAITDGMPAGRPGGDGNF